MTVVLLKNFQNKKVEQLVKNLLDIKKLKLRASELFAKPKKHGLDVPIHQDNFIGVLKFLKL